MQTRPEKERIHTRISTFIIGALAMIILVAGLIIIFGNQNLSKELQPFSVVIGLSCIIFSAFLFVIVNIANDLHYQRHLQEHYIDEATYFHTQSMQMLRHIEFMLEQQNYQQQTQNQQQQSELQQNTYSGELEQPEQSQYKKPTNPKLKVNQTEDSPYDYKAQYRQPI